VAADERRTTEAGPALTVSTVEGTLLAHLTHSNDTHSVLTKPAGTASAGTFIRSWQLSLQPERGRRLLLTRRDRLSTVLGRVTVSTHDAWIGLQQYLVETSPGLDTAERRTVIASVVCLHLLRRPPGGSSAPA
jgi:hypothetical protein